jgi:hypothetical protein
VLFDKLPQMKGELSTDPLMGFSGGGRHGDQLSFEEFIALALHVGQALVVFIRKLNLGFGRHGLSP